MAHRKIYLGIDFGTSNSSIAYIIPDPRDQLAQKINVTSVSISADEGGGTKSDRLPTIIAESMDRRRSRAIFGWDFFTQFFGRRKKAPLLRHGENFFRSIKSDLGSLRVYPHAFSADYHTPEQVASAIIKRLLDEAHKHLPGYDVIKAKLIISVPASLGVLGREHTLAAAAQAGINPENVELIDEPVAALLDFLNSGRAAGILETDKVKNLLIFDFGGGTLDLSLVRARFDLTTKSTGLRVRNLAISQYRRLGGDDIDRAIMDDIVWPQIMEYSGLGEEDYPSDKREEVNDTLTPTIARALKEGICRKISDSMTASGRRSKRNTEFIEKLDVTFEGLDLPKRFRITSEQFERIMSPFLALPPLIADEDFGQNPSSLMRPVLEVLRRGSVEPSQLDAIIFHGSSCRNPLLREMMSDYVGPNSQLFTRAIIDQTPDLDTSVARGAALACYWRNERRTDIVPPIIAEEVGILTLDDKPVKLIDAGASLPFPGEDEVHSVDAEFYVPQDNLKEMLVPFYSGSVDYRVTDAVLVPLPANTRRGTPVTIKLRVDRNKTLHWWYRIGQSSFVSARAVNDPWLNELPSLELKKLHEHRRLMRDRLMSSGSITYEMQRDELALLRKCDKLDEAELMTRDLIRRNGDTGFLANMLGLILAERGDNKAALRWHQKAATLEPQNAIIVGNYGCSLSVAGRYSEAEATIRSTLSINPHLTYLYSWLGDIYRKQGDEERARQEFQEGLRLLNERLVQDKDATDTLNSIAHLYRKLGDYQKAAGATSRASALTQNAELGGDRAHRIAGPDSGIVKSSELF